MNTKTAADKAPAQSSVLSFQQLLGLLERCKYAFDNWGPDGIMPTLCTEIESVLKRGWDPHAMPIDLASVRHAIESAGFRQPPQVFTKPDTRGSEYGHWEVAIRDYDNLAVSHRGTDDGREEFTFYFRGEDALEHFAKWSRNTPNV